DFEARQTPGGNPDFESVEDFDTLLPAENMAGVPCTATNQASCGRLDSDGKPELRNGHSTVPNEQNYSRWDRDNDATGSVEIERVNDVLELTRVGDSEAYVFDSSAYFPLDGRGQGDTCDNRPENAASSYLACCEAGAEADCNDRNFHFTTEL